MKWSRWWIVALGMVFAVCVYAVYEVLDNYWAESQFSQQSDAGGGFIYPREAEAPRPGLNSAAYQEVSYGNKAAFVIWTDLTEEMCQSQGNASLGQGHHSGRFIDRDGEIIVAWESVLPDPAHGDVTIAGRTFKLEDGNLFLVSIRAGPPQILQLRRDLAADKPTDISKCLRRLAERDHEIQQFFSSGGQLKGTGVISRIDSRPL